MKEVEQNDWKGNCLNEKAIVIKVEYPNTFDEKRKPKLVFSVNPEIVLISEPCSFTWFHGFKNICVCFIKKWSSYNSSFTGIKCKN